MKVFRLFNKVLMTVSILLIHSFALAQQYTLPADPDAVVISLDYQGGRLVRINDSPTMTIHANGRVVLAQNYSHTKSYESFISSTELQRLLAFIISEQQFFNYDVIRTKQMQTKIRHQPLPVHYATTVINVHTADKHKKVSVAGLNQLPIVEANQRILKISQRLDKIMAMTKLGGTVAVQSLLNSAREFALEKLQKTIAFKPDDLKSGSRRPDGSIFAIFEHVDKMKTTQLVVEVSANGQQYVTLSDK